MAMAALHIRATQSLPGNDLQRHSFASYTNIYIEIHMCSHTIRGSHYYEIQLRKAITLRKNNGVFASKVTISRGSRKWTKALIVRELLTPGLKKWPQVSNDALSLELAAAVFHSKLNCQSTVQPFYTIISHLWGKYTKKYYIWAALFQVGLNSPGNGKYVCITEFKNPCGYLYGSSGFCIFLRVLSGNFMLSFFLQIVLKHASD